MSKKGLYLFFMSLFAVPVWAQNANQGGDEEDVAGYGGLSPAEQARLNAKTQQMLKKYKYGRNSSSTPGADGKTRFTNILEQHDMNYDGITDHANGPGLEAAVDNTVEGLKGKRGQERHDVSDKIAAEKDKKRYGGKCVRSSVGCGSKSAVIVDVGSAHDSRPDAEKEEHRAYEVTAEAAKAAAQSGAQYGQKAMEEAVWYEEGGTVAKKIAPNKLRVTGADGKSKVVDINPDIDKLRSEAAYLEEHKARNVRNGWKTFRALRLSGHEGETGSEADEAGSQVAKFYQRNPGENEAVAEARGDAQMAAYIAAKRAYSQVDMCMTPQKKWEPAKADRSNCVKNQQGQAVVKSFEDVRRGVDATGKSDPSNPMRPDDVLALTQKVAASKEGKDRQKEVQKEAETIATCMKAGNWCENQTQKDGTVKLAPKTQGDVGSTFKDTREFVYHQVDQAGKKGIGNYTKNVTNMDFSERTSSDKPIEFQGRKMSTYEAAKLMAADQAKTVQAMQADKRYNGAYNTGMSANQINAVTAKRGASSIDNPDMLNSMNGQAGKFTGTAGGPAPASAPAITPPQPSRPTAGYPTSPY